LAESDEQALSTQADDDECHPVWHSHQRIEDAESDQETFDGRASLHNLSR
jgi:ribosomal protein L31